MSFDVNKIVLWNNFKEKMLNSIDEAPAFEVDLAFEYKDNKGHVVSFTSGQLFCITDIKLSSDGKVCFEVPDGAESRFVSIEFADSVSNPTMGDLDTFMSQVYRECLDAFPEEDKEKLPLTEFALAKGLSKKDITIFNNSAEWIKEKITLEKDKESFETMDQFGMF